MRDEGVYTDDDALIVFEIVPSPIDDDAKDHAISRATNRLKEIALRDGWILVGVAEASVVESVDDLSKFEPSDEKRLQLVPVMAEPVPPGSTVIVVRQSISGPPESTPGLIGKSLVSQTIERLALARLIEHPGESGRAREEAIRRHIQEFLPGGLLLETGFVIDASGSRSRQIDLILYFEDYYPVFRVNGIAIVPIEAVVAVFEVKADVRSRAVLTDCYDVLASVKSLDRSNGGENLALFGGRPMAVKPSDYERFQFQVLGAVVAERSIGPDVWFEATQQWCTSQPRKLWPNFFVSATSFVGTYQRDNARGMTEITADTESAARLAVLSGNNSENPLAFLTHEILNFARVAVRIDYSPMSYLGGSRNLGVVTRPFGTQ